MVSSARSSMSEIPTTQVGRSQHGVRTLDLPLFGRIVADDELRRRVERRFQWPMVTLSFVFVGLLAIELLLDPQGWQAWAVDAGFGIVWLAFVLELVVKTTLAESRFEYLRTNWLDLLIIALPMLRSVRAARALVTMSRSLRLRGAATKLVRVLLPSVIGLKATESLLRQIKVVRRDEKKPADKTRSELEAEVRRLRKLVRPAPETEPTPLGGEDAAQG
jgi:hypothetical protein